MSWEVVRRIWLEIITNSSRPSVEYSEEAECLGTSDMRRICTHLMVFLHETHCYLIERLEAARES